ncbi:MAG: transglycosylase SLT domain-containing protein [Caldilineales bacterium]|nr:transglycosylase SLT domain-containing protein [Caldilineales bacterium]
MEFEALFARVAAEYGLDKHMLAEQAWRESRWDPLAIGASSDMGLMQILPAAWQEWAPKVQVYDPFDPESNLRVAAAYLAFLRGYLPAQVGVAGDYWMLVAYKWGAGNVRDLITRGQGWEQTPQTHREYAISILTGAEARALAAAEPL